MISLYQDLLTALAEKAGLEAPSLLATEEIVLDDLPIGMQLVGEGEQAQIVLFSLLGDVPAERLPEVGRYLLLANHLWVGTGGATLGLLDEGNTVSLSVGRTLQGLDAHQLSQWLSQFADIGLAWKEFISQPLGTLDAPLHPAWPDAAAGLRV